MTGVEINGQILEIVNGPFGNYSGHLDRNPRVQFVNDEARSYLARTDRFFDLIQISLIDTWAATAAGAFVLTENSLYTVEAWTTFLKRLTAGGLLSVCRWSMESQPAEVYRLVSLAVEALEARGVQNSRQHLVLVRAPPVDGVSIATLLVSGTPFSRRDLDLLGRVAGDLRFEMMMSPDVATDPMLAKLASHSERRDVIASFPLDISAPTDDRPFFFQMLRMRDFFRNERIVGIKLAPNLEAVLVLGTLLATVLGLSVLCIFVPLALTAERSVLRGNGPLLGFFTSIGLGFMTIETAQMQRLIVALGHPTYGLTVVLFALLLSSGLGSYLTAGVSEDRLAMRGARRLAILVALLVIVGIITPPVMHWVEAESTILRIAVAAAMLLPIGTFMGMAFPLGMKLAARSADKLTPWLWGVNGAMSVSAAVLAIVVALSTSISTAYWVGVAAYAGAAISWWSATRSRTT